MLGGQRADRRRVDAAGQECPERGVAAQVDRDRSRASRPGSHAGLDSLGDAGGPQVGPPEAVDVHAAAGPGDHGVAGRQHLDRRSHGVRRRARTGRPGTGAARRRPGPAVRPGSASALRSEANRSSRPARLARAAMAGGGGRAGGRRGMRPQRTFFMRYARPTRPGRQPAWLPGRSPSGAEPVIQGCRRVSLLRRGRIAGRRWRRMPAATRAGPGARGRCATVPAATSAVGLAGDHAGPAVDAVVEGLDAERVPGAEQFAGPGVPDGEGEHAAEPVHHVLAHQGVGLEQHLGVTRWTAGSPPAPAVRRPARRSCRSRR